MLKREILKKKLQKKWRKWRKIVNKIVGFYFNKHFDNVIKYSLRERKIRTLKKTNNFQHLDQLNMKKN